VFPADGSIRVWDVRDPAAPAALAVLSGPANPSTVGWMAGSQTLVGAAADATPLTWDINADDIAHRIPRVVRSRQRRGEHYRPVSAWH
jgi:hypothetical protein